MLGLLSVYTRLHASISAFLHLSPQFDLWSLWDWWESLRVSQIHGQFGSKFGSLQAGWPAEQHPRSSREEQLLSPNHLIIFEWCWSLVTYQTWINLLLKINWGQILIFVAFQMMSRGNVWETVLRGDTKSKSSNMKTTRCVDYLEELGQAFLEFQLLVVRQHTIVKL